MFLYLFFGQFNSYGGSFRILFLRLSYQFIRCFNPTGVSLKTLSSYRYLSYSFSMRISSMPNPFARHQFKLMKDKHNVILILVSSKRLIPYSGGSSNSRFHLFHLFFSGVPSSLSYFITEIHLNHFKASLCVLNFFFLPSSSSFCYRSSS